MCLKLAVEHVKIYTLKICECSICVLDLIKAIFVYKNVTYNLSFFIFYLAVLPLRTDQVTGPSNVVDWYNGWCNVGCMEHICKCYWCYLTIFRYTNFYLTHPNSKQFFLVCCINWVQLNALIPWEPVAKRGNVPRCTWVIQVDFRDILYGEHLIFRLMEWLFMVNIVWNGPIDHPDLIHQHVKDTKFILQK